MSEHHSPVMQSAVDAQDDIVALRAAFTLQDWHYMDIARQERLTAIFSRWPLLAELSAESLSEGH